MRSDLTRPTFDGPICAMEPGTNAFLKKSQIGKNWSRTSRRKVMSTDSNSEKYKSTPAEEYHHLQTVMRDTSFFPHRLRLIPQDDMRAGSVTLKDTVNLRTVQEDTRSQKNCARRHARLQISKLWRRQIFSGESQARCTSRRREYMATQLPVKNELVSLVLNFDSNVHRKVASGSYAGLSPTPSHTEKPRRPIRSVVPPAEGAHTTAEQLSSK